MFSDQYKFIKLFLGTALIISLCFFASVKGRALELEKERQFFYCLENAAHCQSLPLSKWIKITGCKNKWLIAETYQSFNEGQNKSFSLNISCSRLTTEERIRVLGSFTKAGIFEVDRFHIDNLKNSQIQWGKYIISILGLLLAIFFLAKNLHRDN